MVARHVDHVIQMEGMLQEFFLETIVGTNGLLIPPAEYLTTLKKICEKHGALLI